MFNGSALGNNFQSNVTVGFFCFFFVSSGQFRSFKFWHCSTHKDLFCTTKAEYNRSVGGVGAAHGGVYRTQLHWQWGGGVIAPQQRHKSLQFYLLHISNILKSNPHPHPPPVSRHTLVTCLVLCTKIGSYILYVKPSFTHIPPGL